jgi:hypothetical protein
MTFAQHSMRGTIVRSDGQVVELDADHIVVELRNGAQIRIESHASKPEAITLATGAAADERSTPGTATFAIRPGAANVIHVYVLRPADARAPVPTVP